MIIYMNRDEILEACREWLSSNKSISVSGGSLVHEDESCPVGGEGFMEVFFKAEVDE